MIKSVYILSSKNVILLEKHCKSVIDKSVYRQFLEADYESNNNPNTISPIIYQSKHILVHIRENHLVFLAICDNEVNPLMVIEFLKRVVQVFEYYFRSVSDSILEENLVIVYEILDEMLDNGAALVTEPNILEELVKPPNILRAISDHVTRQHGTTITSVLPASQLSLVPWRRVGVKYPHNEAYIDFYETIDAIFDQNGSVLLSEIVGIIKANVRLSGMPDLLLYFNNARLIDDIALHPCIRYSKWNRDKVLSFVPPDGQFELCQYYVCDNSNVSVPLTIKSLSKIDENRSFLDISIVANKINSKRSVENLEVCINLPAAKLISSVKLKGVSHGKAKFDSINSCVIWNISKLDAFSVATLKAPVILHPGSSIATQSCPIDITAQFKIEQCTLSGINASKVEVTGEKYVPFKGVKYTSQSGRYVMRS